MCVLPRCVLGAHGGQERILIPGPGVAEGSELPGQYSEANRVLQKNSKFS